VTDSSTPHSLSQALTLTINKAAVVFGFGSESLLKGQYAFMLSGYTIGLPGRNWFLTADGTGKIKAGVIDSNGAWFSRT